MNLNGSLRNSLALLCSLIYSNVHAQSEPPIAVIRENGSQIEISALNGQPFHGSSDVSGSPFYLEQARLSNLTLYNGQLLKNFPCKIDLYRNEVHFLNQAEEYSVPAGTVRRMSFIDSASGDQKTFQCGFLANGDLTSNSMYQVLEEGEYTLLISLQKTLSVDHNALTGERSSSFELFERWFILTGDKFYQIRKDQAVLRRLATGHPKALALLDDRRITIKNPDLLRNLIQLCNSD